MDGTSQRGAGCTRRAVLAGLLAAAAGGRSSAARAGGPIPRNQRINGSAAPWNRPVAGMPRDPKSVALSTLLWDHTGGRPGNFNLNFDEAFAVYFAEDAPGTLPIAIAWGGPLNGRPVPWNPAWRIPPGTDRKVIILDRRTGREWDLFQVVFADGTLRATNGSLVPGRYDTYTGTNAPSRGAGIQYAAMLVRPAEIRQGRIEHALAMSIDNTDGRRFVPPAVKLEHPGPRTGVPEGTRFALDCSDADVDAWVGGLPDDVRAAMAPAARTIARALRRYGWFITDTGGAGCFEFEARASAEGDWLRLGLGERAAADGKVYPRDLLDGLLAPGRIYALAPSGRQQGSAPAAP